MGQKEIKEACQCVCPTGVVLSKISTSADACADTVVLSAKSVTLCCLDHCPRP